MAENNERVYVYNIMIIIKNKGVRLFYMLELQFRLTKDLELSRRGIIWLLLRVRGL